MTFAEMAYVKPQVRSVVAVDTVTIAHALRHVSRYDVAAGEFLFLRFGLDHEAMQVLVEQVTAVAPGSLGNQDAAGRECRRMKLHSFHIA